jgi:hypothetical protein
MVTGEGPVTRSQLSAPLVRQLISVDAHTQTEVGCCIKDPRGLLSIEADCLAEGVHGVDETIGTQLWKGATWVAHVKAAELC